MSDLVYIAIFVPIAIVLALISVFEYRRIEQMSKRLDALTMGVDGKPLEGVLDSHLESVFRVSHDLNQVTARTIALEAMSRRHFGRVGVVRFNPFDDTGGNQSFALVMMDADENGLILSSLHSRNGTRLYAKVMARGQCETPLSAEEAQALEMALAQSISVPKAPDRASLVGWGDEKDEAGAESEDEAAGESAADQKQGNGGRTGKAASISE